MEHLPNWVQAASYLIGIPVYGYFLFRWLTSAVVRTYFEIKREFQQPQPKKEVG
jgi:hypothetical protein